MDYRNALKAGQDRVTQAPSGGLLGSPMEAAENAAKRQPYVSSSIIGLEARVDDVLALVSNLEQRLGPILRSSGPATQGQEAKRPQTGVGLADALDNYRDRLEAAVYGLNDIMGRIEL